MTARCVTAARKFDKTTQKTLLSEAINVANSVTDEWEDMTDIQAAELAEETVADYKPSVKKVRKSEWKQFYMAAHHGMADALEYIEAQDITFSRVKLFQLARVLPTVRGFKKAVEQVINPPKGKGRKATIGMGLGIIKNLETRAKNIIAFRKELAALCAKHGIKY